MSDVKSGDPMELGGVARTKENSNTVRRFACGGPHYKNNCPQAKAIQYYMLQGHIARNCNQTVNVKGALPAPAITSKTAMAQSYQE